MKACVKKKQIMSCNCAFINNFESGSMYKVMTQKICHNSFFGFSKCQSIHQCFQISQIPGHQQTVTGNGGNYLSATLVSFLDLNSRNLVLMSSFKAGVRRV